MSQCNNNQSIEPLKVSSAAALGGNLGNGDPLKDQKTTPEEKIRITGKKCAVDFETSN